MILFIKYKSADGLHRLKLWANRRAEGLTGAFDHSLKIDLELTFLAKVKVLRNNLWKLLNCASWFNHCRALIWICISTCLAMLYKLWAYIKPLMSMGSILCSDSNSLKYSLKFSSYHKSITWRFYYKSNELTQFLGEFFAYFGNHE